jgi:hypothetical protein
MQRPREQQERRGFYCGSFLFFKPLYRLLSASALNVLTNLWVIGAGPVYDSRAEVLGGKACVVSGWNFILLCGSVRAWA